MEKILEQHLKKTRSVLDTALDEVRKKKLAHEYLTRLQEIKEWIEEILSIDLGSAADLGISLQNGVVLAHLAEKFAPQVVGKIVTFKMLSLKHTDNINYFIEMQKLFKIPDVVFFEVNDLYSLKNVINVVYSVYYTATKLHKKGLAPPVKSLKGKAKFTEEEQKKAIKQLEKADVSKIEQMSQLTKKKTKAEEWIEKYNKEEALPAILIIQSVIKCKFSHIHKKELSQLFNSEEYKKWLLSLQGAFKHQHLQKQHQEHLEFLKENKEEVSKIQEAAKGFIERQKSNQNTNFLKENEEDVSKIQEAAKGFIARQKTLDVNNFYKENEEDVSKIQEAAKGFIARQKSLETTNFYKENEEDENEEDVSKIQEAAKGFIARQKSNQNTNFLKENEEDVSKIQEAAKGFIARQKSNQNTNFLKENEEDVSKIQEAAKGFIARQKSNETIDSFKKNEEEIAKIQQIVKGFMERKKFQEISKMGKEEYDGNNGFGNDFGEDDFEIDDFEDNENENTEKTDGLDPQRRGRKKMSPRLLGVLTIQKHVKRMLIQREMRRRRRFFRSQKKPISKIQAFRKQYLAHQHFKRQRKSAVKIQKTFRGFKSREMKRSLAGQNEMTLETMANILRMFRVRSGMIYDNEKMTNDEKIKTTQEEDLTKLREDWVKEIRQNNDLQHEVQRVDKKISLLVKNRISIQEIDSQSSKRKKQDESKENMIPSQYIEIYQHLFYLLQTEPKYLAKTLFYIQPNELEGFVQTMILTLYGYAFSPREEYLLLRLFTLSIGEQIFKQKKASEFTKDDPIITKMFVFYFRRVQYQTFLKELLEPVVEKVLKQEDLVIELNTTRMYQAMINKEETRTGQKSDLPRTANHEDAIKHQAISELYEKNINELSEICRHFVNQISKSIHTIPYGIRFICKAVRRSILEKFPDTNEDEISRIIGYIIYYRYLLPAIVQPDTFGVVAPDFNISLTARQNLALISKMMQSVATHKLFEKNEPYMIPLNNLIEELSLKSFDYFKEIPNVLELEEQLQITSDYDLTQQKMPTIFVSPKEIFYTHQILKKFLSKIAPEKNDPLRIILDDLKDVKIPSKPSEMEIQLMLINKFQTDAIKDTETQTIYNDTKKLIKDLLTSAPPDLLRSNSNLIELIFNDDLTQNSLQDILVPLRKNITFLEEKGVLNKADNFKNLIKEIVHEIRNASKLYRQNQVEIARLKKNLSIVRQSKQYLIEQMKQYNDYLDSVRKKQYELSVQKMNKKNLKKKKSEYICGPVSKKYKALAKANIIISSDIPKATWGATSFVFTSKQTGIFDIQAKFAGASVEKITINVEDLLEFQSSGKSEYPVERLTLNVNLLIHFLNKMMVK
ncbi:patterned expression site [Anaeramoeba ignava]|uniref:Patterned expression site n=1 Tax=Anaeramoeba ignava TaxID=1746090 RepID=A0A9Q0LSJ6_ANAIG|nr:patterned expression site [Anaeramoeba ignava]